MHARLSFLALVVIAFAWTAAAQTNQSSSNPAASSGTTINAVLDKSIDAKKVKPGEQVEAKTTADAMIAGTTIPRGSKLIGHVTEAKPHEKGSGASSLGIQFDQVVVKGGQQVPIHTAIQAIAAPQPSAPIGSAPDMSAGGGGYGQGGYGQGGYGSTGTPRGVGQAPTAPMGGVGPNPGETSPAATTASSAPNSGGQLSASSTGVLGIKDLKLESTASDSTQGSVITSDNKNVKLDAGTHLLLRVTGQ